MANIVVTSSNNLILVDFGTYAGSNGLPKKRIYEKSRVFICSLEVSDAYVSILVEGDSQWNIAYTATTNCLIVDSIDGSAPSSNSDLYDKLSNLLTDCLTPVASANVTCNNTTTSLVSANEQRKGLVITNTGSNAIYLGLGESAVVNKGIYLAASGGTWVMDKYTFTKSAINGITVASTSNISIQEFK